MTDPAILRFAEVAARLLTPQELGEIVLWPIGLLFLPATLLFMGMLAGEDCFMALFTVMAARRAFGSLPGARPWLLEMAGMVIGWGAWGVAPQVRDWILRFSHQSIAALPLWIVLYSGWVFACWWEPRFQQVSGIRAVWRFTTALTARLTVASLVGPLLLMLWLDHGLAPALAGVALIIAKATGRIYGSENV